MKDFSWLITGKLAASSRPGGYGSVTDLARDLDWLLTQGVKAVSTLTPEPLVIDVFRRRRPDLMETFTCLHLPVRDFHAPSPDQLEWAIDFIERQNRQKSAVLVHCLGGLGRTGTVLACTLSLAAVRRKRLWRRSAVPGPALSNRTCRSRRSLTLPAQR